MMAMAYSQGFDGSTFQTQQLLDCPNEEAVYGKLWKKEKLRFNKLHKMAVDKAEECYQYEERLAIRQENF